MNVLIVCGGTPPTKKLIETEINNAKLVIGADSGGHAILGYGFTPDIVLGDLDSFHYTRHQGIKVLKDEDQETNDLEKSLVYALKQGATHCVVLGTLGKRIDHTFKNLSVLKQFHHKFESLVYRDDYGDTFLIESPYELTIDLDTVISFIPLSGKVSGITTTGVQYPLRNESLEIGVRDGTSNSATSTTVTAVFEDGDMALFVGTGGKLAK
tara:strand:- start:30842 stop:31474 length:633 start_codon:yes stop_codon:yes gene_type:complete